MSDGQRSEWPTYDDNSLKGDIGVALVRVAVAKKLRWAFREKSQIDLGIDGELEVREPDGKSHGRLISAQIKCGSSFFRSENENGFRYRPKPQHLNYWLGYTTPVILVLVDDETETCYWQHISVETITDVDGINVIDVPRNQTLDPTSLTILKKVADGAQQIDMVRQLFRVWMAESSLFSHRWNNELQIPRDMHGFDLYLPRLPDRGATVADVVVARPGFGDDEDATLKELLCYGAYNVRGGYCDHIMVGLVSPAASALSRDRLPQPPQGNEFGATVEFIPLLLDENAWWPRLVEVDADLASLEDELRFLYMRRDNATDVETNERYRRANRLWGSL